MARPSTSAARRRQAIFSFIARWYKPHRRRQSALGQISPREIERRREGVDALRPDIGGLRVVHELSAETEAE